MIAGPLLLLVLPLAMAGIVYILLRWATLSALLSVGTALVLGVAVIALPLDQAVSVIGGREVAMGEAVTIFGRELVFEQADRLAMAFLFFTAAGLFFLAWRFSPGTLFFPMGLGLLSLLSGALLIRPLIYAALLFEVAAALSVFTLQMEGRRPSRGALRYLTFTTVALPGLLVTHWLLERYAVTPDETELAGAAAVLLTISFAMLLGVVPFHTWVPAITRSSVPLAAVFVLTVSHGTVWFLLLDFLETYPWLSGQPMFAPLVSGAGLAMVLVGGLLAPARRRLAALIGYASLVDGGAALIALGLNTRLGVMTVLLSVLARPFGLGLLGAGLSGLRACSGGSDERDGLRGLGWRAPGSTAAVVVGALSTAGLPVSAGFVWRWALSRALVPIRPVYVVFILLAGVGVMVGAWRSVSMLLRRLPPAKDRSVVERAASEGRVTSLVVAAAILACLWIGLTPQILASVAVRLADGYTFFQP